MNLRAILDESKGDKMGFYDLSKAERQELVKKIQKEILNDLIEDEKNNIYKYSADSDTYIRKNAYLSLGRIYQEHEDQKERILTLVDDMLENSNEKIRQTSVYALGEIGKKDADHILNTFIKAMEDGSPLVRNAVIGSLKQMGQKNPGPTLKFASSNLHHSNPEVRREMVHGIELRGRTHPEDVLPLLEELQDEENKRVRDIILHVLGQISYKDGCLETVVAALKNWENDELVEEALREIVEVHERYKFSSKSQEEAESYIKANFDYYTGRKPLD